MQFFPPDSLQISNVENVTQTDPSNLDQHSSFSITVEFINGTNQTITVVDRAGVYTVIPPCNLRGVNSFIVRKRYIFTESVKFDAMNVSNDIHENSSTDLIALKNAIIEQQFVKFRGKYYVNLDFNIDILDLREKGGACYYQNIDLLLSCRNEQTTPPHPFSQRGRERTMVTEDPDINRLETFGYKIKIVDNNNEFGDRFVNIAKSVFRVPATKDINSKDGVYLIVTGNAKGAPPTVEYFTFDSSGSNLHLYRTREEAAALGDLHKQREQELALLEHQVKASENDYKLERQKLTEAMDAKEREFKIKELEYNEAKQKLEKEKAEQEHKRKMEELYRKDYYEDRSYVRKDSSEFLKYAPLLLTGVIALFAAIRG